MVQSFTTFVNFPGHETEADAKKFDFSKKMFYSDENKIKILDLKTKKTSVFLEVKNKIIAFDVVKSVIFYIEDGSFVIKSSSPKFGNVKYTSKVKTKAMAIDYLTEKVYLLDQIAGTIIVIDMINNFHGVVLSDLEDLHDITLDIEQGFMFIVKHSKSVCLHSY